MVKRLLDARVIISDTAEIEEMKIYNKFVKIREFLGISKESEILKACINKAFDYYYAEIIEFQKKIKKKPVIL